MTSTCPWHESGSNATNNQNSNRDTKSSIETVYTSLNPEYAMNASTKLLLKYFTNIKPWNEMCQHWMNKFKVHYMKR
jgi:hypothetical protein